jgi:Tfp pilus assembly protein FimT
MKPQRKAVTLVELLIVVLLIGIMTFIAVPRMGFSIITGGKAQTTAQRVAAAIRHTRSLAIANAAINNQGFTLNIAGSSNPCYTIVDVNTGRVVETGSIASDVNCTGADDFQFGPLGSRLGDTDSLTVGAGRKTYIISVVSATGMVRCIKQ